MDGGAHTAATGAATDRLIFALDLASVGEALALTVRTGVDKLPHERLSDREYEVLCLIASGQTVSDIAESIHLSVTTISTYRARILDKMNLKNNAELTRYALQHGLVV